MLCPSCKLDMVVKKRTPDGPVYVCVNPRCPHHDKEMTTRKEEKTKP